MNPMSKIKITEMPLSSIGKLSICLMDFFLIQGPVPNFYFYIGMDLLGFLAGRVERTLYSDVLQMRENFFNNSENDKATNLQNGEKILEILGKMDILKDQLDVVIGNNKSLETHCILLMIKVNDLMIKVQSLTYEIEKRK